MRKARTDRPLYAWVRRGNLLAPEMEYDLRALDGVANGQRVALELKQWRNRDRLRAYWASLQDCIDATGCAPSKETLDSYVRRSVGYVDMVRRIDGKVEAVPRPLNLADCSEPEMIAYFQAAEQLLAEHFGFVSERARKGMAA